MKIASARASVRIRLPENLLNASLLACSDNNNKGRGHAPRATSVGRRVFLQPLHDLYYRDLVQKVNVPGPGNAHLERMF